MADLTNPFQGKCWYFVQTDYDTAPTDGGTTYAISCQIVDARIETGDRHEETRGIDSSCANYLHPLVEDFTFHLEYNPQCDDTLLDKIIDKDANCKLTPLAFCLLDNTCGADADRTAYFITSCKPKTVRVSAGFNELYLITVDFSAKSIISDGDGSYPAGADKDGVGAEPAKLTGAYLGFNMGGSILKDGSDVAHIVDSVDITFNFGIIDKYDHDSMVKQYAIEGETSVTGSFDLSLDEGGGIHWAEVMNQSEFDVIIDLGGSSCPRITIPNCKWKNTSGDINITSEPVMSSVPFTSRPASSCTDGFVSSAP